MIRKKKVSSFVTVLADKVSNVPGKVKPAGEKKLQNSIEAQSESNSTSRLPSWH